MRISPTGLRKLRRQVKFFESSPPSGSWPGVAEMTSARAGKRNSIEYFIGSRGGVNARSRASRCNTKDPHYKRVVTKCSLTLTHSPAIVGNGVIAYIWIIPHPSESGRRQALGL